MKKRHISIIFLLPLFFTSCTGLKKLSEEQILYTGADIVIESGTAKQKRKLKDELYTQIRLNPNTKTLGLFRTKLWLNQHIKEPKKEKGLRNWLKNKIGEAPVLINEREFKRTALFIGKRLMDLGYLDNEVRYQIKKNGKTGSVVYQIQTNGQYKIRNIHLPSGGDTLRQLIAANPEAVLLKEGNPYDAMVLKEQREKLTALVRNEGYYDFSKEYIYYYVDTFGNKQLADLYIKIQQPADSIDHVQYHIRQVYVYTDYSIDQEETNQDFDTIQKQGVYFISAHNFVKPKAINRTLQLTKGQLFSQHKHDQTINHLLDLNVFKFVNVQYSKTGTDSLDIVIKLTPSNTQDFKAEVEASNSNRNFLGSYLSLGYNNRNLFKGGQSFKYKVFTGTEFQFTGEGVQLNTLNFGADLSLSVPRFITPFKKLNQKSLDRLPRTRFTLREDFQRWIELYSINSVKLSLGYEWRGKREKLLHQFNGINVNKIKLVNTTSAFDDRLEEDEALKASFEDILIWGLDYTFVVSTKNADKPRKNHIYFKGHGELAGNLLYGIFSLVSPNGEKPYILVDNSFSQFARFEADFRDYHPIAKKALFASRIAVGVGVPYGNSEVLPYVRQFFSGGPNSIRAFNFRSIGPGSYIGEDSDNTFTNINQYGNFKVELNAELRFGILGFLKGAIFVDAGNVWLLKSEPSRPGGTFQVNNFYRELAIGTGLGARLDFDFFVIRFDAGLPIRNPSLSEDSRWSWNESGFMGAAWRKENIIYNLAIGYPF